MDKFFPPSVRMMSPLLALIAALLVQGCAKPYSAALRQFNESPVCCTSLAELPVEQIQVGDKKSFDLGGGSPVYRFDTGKSYFRAFALPQGPYPYRVTVRSFIIGDDLRTAYFFFPQLITLDENRKIIRSTARDTFTLKWADYLETMRETGGLRHKLEGRLTFPDASLGERYLVILTTDELLQGTTPVPSVGDVPLLTPGYTVAAPGENNEVQVAHAPAGRVGISLSPLPPEPQTAAVKALTAGTAAVAPTPLPPPEVVTLRLANGNAAGSLELGRTTVDSARSLFDNAGAGLGPERQNTATFSVGTATIAPRRLFTPPASHYQLYFDDDGILVLFVDGTPADLPASGAEFRRQFPEARESGRNQFSYEMLVPRSACITLIAHFSTINDTLEFAAYGYGCRGK